MERQRKSYSAEFKAKVALAAAKGQKTLSELAEQYGVHPNQISKWKAQLIESASGLFRDAREKKKEKNSIREEELYEQIGRLKVELDWLKKKVDEADA
jgi:transposase-like protein